MARKPLTIPKLIKKADKIFSKMIRLDAANLQGNCRCVCCGKIDHYKNMDCGHFACRFHGAVRFHPWNTAVQCPACNRYREGESALFAKYIIEQYGKEAIDTIAALSSQPFKWDREKLEKLIEVCTQKVKRLQKTKGLY